MKLKSVLGLLGAFTAYRFYKLYELGENVIYKPFSVKFIRGKTINDFIIQVTMEIMNPTNTTLSMRGIDGTLAYHVFQLISKLTQQQQVLR